MGGSSIKRTPNPKSNAMLRKCHTCVRFQICHIADSNVDRAFLSKDLECNVQLGDWPSKLLMIKNSNLQLCFLLRYSLHVFSRWAQRIHFHNFIFDPFFRLTYVVLASFQFVHQFLFLSTNLIFQSVKELIPRIDNIKI